MEKIIYCDHIPKGVCIKIDNNTILVGTAIQTDKGDVSA